MEDKIQYKIIFSDLDETLLVNNHIPSFNLESINKAREKGVKFVICTGRNHDLICHLLKELKIDNLENEYCICCSGSTIYENKNNKLIYFNGIDKDTIKFLFEYGSKIKDIFILIYAIEGTYVYNEEMIEDKEDFKELKYTVIKSLDEVKDNKIIKIIYSKKDLNYLLNLQNEIKNNKNFKDKVIHYVTSNRFLEFNRIGISKGEALKWLCNYLKIDKKQSIAIGNNYNDESMIKEAGLGCCVKSANNDIKKISNYICEKDYYEGSVKEVIEKFILK